VQCHVMSSFATVHHPLTTDYQLTDYCIATSITKNAKDFKRQFLIVIKLD